MWTNKNRSRYDRSKLRYPSDLTDGEWQLVEPLIPPGKPGGGKRTANMREVVNGLVYVLSTGCQWRAIPKDLPPKSTVYDHFDLWTYDGTLVRIHHALYVQCREQPLPQARQGLGEPQSQGARLLVPRFNSPHAQKTLQSAVTKVSGQTLNISPAPAALAKRTGKAFSAASVIFSR
jgi:transposase